MATKNDFPLIRGRKMRITRLDGCGRPMYGDEGMAVSEGFVSVAFTAQTTEAEEIVVTNAGGKTCARDAGSPEFNGYSLEITFCGVQPCIIEMLTGQPPVTDALGDVVGFKMNTGVDTSTVAFALEVWAGVPGVECSSDAEEAAGSYGYILVPFVAPGVVGDFTIENAAINFVITGATTKDGNGWGVGPYEVVPGVDGACTVLPDPLDGDDHLYVIWTSCLPPENTDGCEVIPDPPVIPIEGVVNGAPGSWVPGNATAPADLAGLKADPVVGDAGSAKPSAPWTVGDYIELGDGSSAAWNGVEWVIGPLLAISGVVEGTPGMFEPASARLPGNLADLTADAVVGVGGSNAPTTAWTTGNSVVLADASDAHWDGAAWVVGAAPAASAGRKK
jgi:hypothetical protein